MLKGNKGCILSTPDQQVRRPEQMQECDMSDREEHCGENRGRGRSRGRGRVRGHGSAGTNLNTRYDTPIRTDLQQPFEASEHDETNREAENSPSILRRSHRISQRRSKSVQVPEPATQNKTTRGNIIVTTPTNDIDKPQNAQMNEDGEENNNEGNLQESIRQTRNVSRQEYLDSFNAHENGPLHDQPYVQKCMKKFHNDLKKYQSRHCNVCKELWPTSENNENEDEYTCRRCEKEKKSEDKFHKFGIDNDMIRDLTTIPDHIQIHFANLSMLEEMLLSPVLPIMTVYRLPSGGNVSRGFVANFRQDSVSIIKEIPLQPKDIPLVVIRRQGQNNTSADFKVNR